MKKIGNVIIDNQYARKSAAVPSKEEQRLEELVSSCAENEYNQKIAQEKNWAVLFSLSHIRQNAVEWLPIRKQDHILEIGAGTGALTAILAQKASTVTCIEASESACRINAMRNQNREGIRILNGVYEDVAAHLEERYDWIFLMGAFEDAKQMISGKDPYHALLESVKTLLAPKGKVVLASENRLGLRYFAGCREPYSGSYFTGIEGYREEEKRTFSRTELEKRIRQAGFQEMTCYYPYPDYRLPMTVYSDEYLPKVGELWDNLRNFDQERYCFFDEAKAYDQIIEDGLFPIFSNSFLAVLQQETPEKAEEQIVFAKYSNERSEKFAIRTDIRKDRQGNLHVRKMACYPEGKSHIEQLERWEKELNAVYADSRIKLNRCKHIDTGCEVEFLQGETLEEELDRLLLDGKQEEAVARLFDYIQVIKKAGSTERFLVTPEFERVFGEVLLPEELTCAKVTDIDMVVGNVIGAGKDWIHMDYEWTFDFPVPVNYVIYRVIQNYLYGNLERGTLKKELLYKKAGLTEQEIAQYTNMEQAFQRYITGTHIPLRHLYEEISPGCVNFRKQEEQRQETARMHAQANQGIEIFVDTFEIAMTGIHVYGWAVSKAEKQVSFVLCDEQGRSLETVQTEYLYRRDVAERFQLSGISSKAGFHLECRLPQMEDTENYSSQTPKKHKMFTLMARDGIHETAFPIPVEKLRLKQSLFGKKLMQLCGKQDIISYIAPHEMGLFGEGKAYRVENQRFDTWQMAHCFTEEDRKKQESSSLSYIPKISILIYDIEALEGKGEDEKATAETLNSIDKQTWKSIEILHPEKKDCGQEDYEKRLIEAAESAQGTYLMLMSSGDTLEPGACYEAAAYLNRNRDTDLLYCDSDKWDIGKREYFDPQFKPDDSIYTLLSGNYIGNSIWIKTDLVKKAGGIRWKYRSGAVYDLILRCRSWSGKMGHISKLLYHQNCPMERDFIQRQELCREWEAGRKVLQDYLAERSCAAEVSWANYPLRYRVKWQVKGNPKVSVIIPNQDHHKDLEQCLRSIQRKSTYANYEVLVVENNSWKEETFAYYKEMQEKYPFVRLLNWEKEFNYSAINNFAVSHADGEYLIFLNNDTEILTPDWIEELLSVCQQKQVGVAGAKLYYPDHTIQHVGVILGLGTVAGHLFVKEPGDISGYMGRACTMQNLSAVTAACMMASRSVFEQVGGFEETLQVALNDVDFCLKVQEAGYLVVLNPEAELYHYESKSRGLEDTPEKKARYDRETAYFKSRWGEILKKGDPYYNVNLSRTTWNCTLRIPPKKEEL